MDIKKQEIMINDEQTWNEFTLINDNDMRVSCLNYGGIITRVIVPDHNNEYENVVLGFENYKDYLDNPNFFGALIGRVAGRIQGSSFELNGTTYDLPANDGANHLHGGPDGFHQVIWDVETFQDTDNVGLILTHRSQDGLGGYPGNVEVKVTYNLNNSNQFSITYEAVSDKRTAFTMTNHSYFNLSGNLKADILNHEVTLESSKFVELDSDLIPTGKLNNVADSTFDFRNGRQIKDGVGTDNPQNEVAKNGYDHYFVFDKKRDADVSVEDKTSGRKLDIRTDQPGMVLYTSNVLDTSNALSHGRSRQHLGVCLETQASPASLHHEGFPSCVLEANEAYRYTTTFCFGTVK
ncbi:aldose epimerase family protein [Virgibacillus flavescens]|uniref:aldose epimerase family protein n=1 Tax=Virgibacillus flavescens TaxID=1611422 RepID=UPI003D335FDD